MPDQRWCRQCKSEYEKANRKRRHQRAVDGAYRRGFEALKADLTMVFLRIGKAEMNGYSAAEIVKNAKPEVPRGTLRVTAG
jgi:hypothetical protein